MEKLISEIEEALFLFEATFSSIDEYSINVVPFEGNWTAGQVAEHTMLSNAGFVELVNGPIGETSKPADEMVEKIKADFLNFNIKMKAPDFIYPENKDYNKLELLKRMGAIRLDFLNAAKGLDLTKTCLAFEIPVYGYFTRLEALYFVIAHTKRHTFQLQNLQNQLELT